jgi:hypothetical protein
MSNGLRMGIYVLVPNYILLFTQSPTPHSKTLLSPFPMSLKCTSSNRSSSRPASLSASSTVQIFLFRNQLMNPPPFFTSSCVATQYFARSILCASTPFFAPRFNCCADPIATSCSPCRKARVCSGGSAFAIGDKAAEGIPWGVYITHSAASPLTLDDISSSPSPFMLREE